MNIDSKTTTSTTSSKLNNVKAANSEAATSAEAKNPDVKFSDELNGLQNAAQEVDQSEEMPQNILKPVLKPDDIIKKGENLINNDFNIPEKKDVLPQMSPNMNFSGDKQPFSSFMGENNEKESVDLLHSTAAELAEEAAILSTMAENIAIANKNNMLAKPVENEAVEKTVNREDGIKKIDTNTGITIENIVKYDTVIMNEADVEVFAAIVENKEIDVKTLAPEAAQKSVHVSKTLADMLVRAKDNQQPLRIDFDNGISVIIKVSRDGKVSADFLPSTQIAETYLKENLPILKQRFDEKNIDYDELNRRERREQPKDENKKKGRKDE